MDVERIPTMQIPLRSLVRLNSGLFTLQAQKTSLVIKH